MEIAFLLLFLFMFIDIFHLVRAIFPLPRLPLPFITQGTNTLVIDIVCSWFKHAPCVVFGIFLENVSFRASMRLWMSFWRSQIKSEFPFCTSTSLQNFQVFLTTQTFPVVPDTQNPLKDHSVLSGWKGKRTWGLMCLLRVGIISSQRHRHGRQACKVWEILSWKSIFNLGTTYCCCLWEAILEA